MRRWREAAPMPSDATEPRAPSTAGVCPITVDHPVMRHRWDRLTFLHWSYDIAAVQRLLPPGLTVEPWDGRAWVGLVPFLMEVKGPAGPTVPWLSRFCETNVRTYVRADDGSVGVWFFSLDAARGPAAAAGRLGYRLPYFWSQMRLSVRSDRADYDMTRRWPEPAPVSSTVSVSIGERFTPAELTDFDHYLTARWRLYSHSRRGLRYALAEHRPWELYRATPITVDDQLITAAGLTPPVGTPICHYSPGVAVRIGAPHRLAMAGAVTK